MVLENQNFLICEVRRTELACTISKPTAFSFHLQNIFWAFYKYNSTAVDKTLQNFFFFLLHKKKTPKNKKKTWLLIRSVEWGTSKENPHLLS